MRTLRLVGFLALTALLLKMPALPALADAEITASGSITDNQITSATIDPTTGIAIVGGTVTCSEPTQVKVYASVRQLRGMSDHFAQYFGATLVACDTTPSPYAVTVTPGYESDRLVPGPASLNTWAEHCTSVRCFGFGTDSDMRLMPAP